MFNKNGIRYKILTPILILIVASTLIMLYLFSVASREIAEDYRNAAIATHAGEVQEFLYRAVSDLLRSGQSGEERTVQARQEAALREIEAHLAEENIEAIFLDSGNRVLFSSASQETVGTLLPYAARKGPFHLEREAQDLHGFSLSFPVWEWNILLLSHSSPPFFIAGKFLFLLVFIVFGSFLMLAAASFIIGKNLLQPMERIMADIRTKHRIGPTGIYELDTVGTVINDTLAMLQKKTEQYQTLHTLSVSLSEELSTDEVLRRIIDHTSRLLHSGISACALFDSQGAITKMITTEGSLRGRESLPQGKGLFAFIHRSSDPVRIDDVAGHAAFSGALPEGHPEVRNLLACTVFNNHGNPIGALYLGNKEGGFTAEEETVLKAIAADAAVALNRAERLAELRKFKQAIDSAFDVIVMTDSEGHITYVNPAFATLTEYTAVEAAGKKTSFLKSGFHSDAFYKELWSTIKVGEIWKGEFINRKKSGEMYHASAIIFPIFSEGTVSYAAIQRDISQEKKLYEQLLRAQKMEAIGTLAGGIAHDFNNLLTAILGYSEILLGRIPEEDSLHRPLSIIYNAAEKGAELGRRILTMTRKEKMETKPVDINGMVESSLELLVRSIPKNIEIVRNLEAGIPLIQADPAQLQQVVMNLAVNARDAMSEGGTLSLETALVGEENGAANDLPSCGRGFVRLSLSDTGTGMDKEIQRKIFDPFFTTKEPGKGTGLGLYIVHSIISNHGGYINVYSEPARGTRFSLYLPVPQGLEVGPAEAAEALEGSGTLLVIDDEYDVRELCKDMLEPFGYRVLLAGSGADGINSFRSSRDEVSLVLLDMIMPKMAGSEVFQALRSMKPDLRILLCSGYSHSGFAGIDTLLNSGAKGFIQKPFTRRTLARAVKKALDDQGPSAV
ncbi:MAG: ATP-binding protein [Thermodesulfovibrionales bacterium]